MVLKAVHSKEDEIPEEFRPLYSEKNGQWELTGIAGVKTEADVARVQDGLAKEREAHKATKAKLAVWDGFEHDEVVAKLDQFPALEAASKGKLDEAKIEEIANQRAEAIAKSRLVSTERELAKATKERDELLRANEDWQAKDRSRKIRDHVMEAAAEAKLLEGAREDALMHAERIFEIQEDGKIQTRDGVGVSPGLDAGAWLSEIQARKPHWWAPSVGGGATGGNGQTPGMARNPWSRAAWNVTEQGRFIREHGVQRAEQMAKAAGSSLSSTKPPREKAKS